MNVVNSISEIQHIIHQLHNFCRDFEDNYDPLMAVDEITKLLFLKLAEERFSDENSKRRFNYKELSKSDFSPKEWVNRLLNENIRRVSKGFPISEGIKLSNKTILKSVKKLENINLLNIDPDVKGIAYERILGNIFRGSLGQYFTPHSITEFMVKLVNPNIDPATGRIDKIIDPGVGCGGFLKKTMKYYREKINDDSKWSDEIFTNLWGIDKVERMVRICSMNLILSSDDIGEAKENIYQGNALLTEDNSVPVKSIEKGEKNSIPMNEFDCLLTNPPFGSKESQEVASSFFSEDEKIHKRTEALFIKRSVELVKPGGKIAIVVPKTILKGPQFQDIQKWIKTNTVIKAVIHLPIASFSPFGSDMKTSILYSIKRDGKMKQQSVFFDAAKFVGHDSSGSSIHQNDLPEILKKYRNKEINDYE